MTPQAFGPFQEQESSPLLFSNGVYGVNERFDTDQALIALKSTGGTGEFVAQHTARTSIHGLRPINIDPRLEFYLGIRNPKTNRYNGDRLFYDRESGEFSICGPEEEHHANQLWRFEPIED